MRHLKSGRKLGRNATHRLALMRNLAAALIERERITTTVEKAKEARRFVEKLITLAKKESLHARRLALAKLGPMASAEILDEEGEPTGVTVLKKLFSEIGPRFADRPGGYTRIIKRHERRLGDAGRTAIFELLKAGETKVRTKAPSPAPRVTDTPPPEEKPAPPLESSGPTESPPAESSDNNPPPK